MAVHKHLLALNFQPSTINYFSIHAPDSTRGGWTKAVQVNTVNNFFYGVKNGSSSSSSSSSSSLVLPHFEYPKGGSIIQPPGPRSRKPVSYTHLTLPTIYSV